MNPQSDPQKTAPGASQQERIPCLFFVFAAIVVLFAAAFFLRYTGSFRWDVYDASGILAGLVPRASGQGTPASGEATQKPQAADPVTVGRELYQANCAACHQPTGQGMTGQFPPVANSEWVNGDPRALIAIMLDGLQGPVRVAGAEYNGGMPAWKSVLTDAKIAAILTFLRQSWGNHAPAVDEVQVKAVRAEIGGHAAPWKAEELQSLPGGKGEAK